MDLAQSSVQDGSSGKNGDFSSWLCGIVTMYKSLGSSDKITVLQSLIDNSEPHQLSFLSTCLPPLLYRDFVSHLPTEIVSPILMYMTGKEILKCCQVCKSWNQRINSLADVWRVKAWQRGVKVDAIFFPEGNVRRPLSSSPSYYDRAKLYKAVYRQAEKFLCGLEKGDQSIKAIQDFVYAPVRDELTHFQCHEGHIITGHLEYIRIWSLFDGSLETEIPIRGPVNRILLYKDHHLFLHTYPATLQIIKVCCCDGDNSRQELHGHVNAILTLDLSPDKNFALTGSCDMTLRLWDLQKKELFMTLDYPHKAPITKVIFLPNSERNELKFVTCNHNGFFSWSIDIHIRDVECNVGICQDNLPEIASFYHDSSNPDTLYATEWYELTRTSLLRSYHLHENCTTIDRDDYWYPLVKGVKAHLLGVGQRFALYHCTISCQDFYLLDLIARCHLVTIATPSFAFESRLSEYLCKLCSTSWLDGFVFEDMHNLSTVFIAKGTRYSLMAGVWNVPPLDVVEDKEEEKPLQNGLLHSKEKSRTKKKKMK